MSVSFKDATDGPHLVRSIHDMICTELLRVIHLILGMRESVNLGAESLSE